MFHFSSRAMLIKVSLHTSFLINQHFIITFAWISIFSIDPMIAITSLIITKMYQPFKNSRWSSSHTLLLYFRTQNLENLCKQKTYSKKNNLRKCTRHAQIHNLCKDTQSHTKANLFVVVVVVIFKRSKHQN